MVHGLESLTSQRRNPVSAAYARAAVRLVARALPLAVVDGSNLEVRSELLLGSHLAGLALTISGLGLVHGIAHAVTAHTGAVHGQALAAVLEQVMAFNEPVSRQEYAEIAADLWVGRADDDAAGNSRATIAAAAGMTRTVGTYASLGDLGCSPAMVPALSATALADPVTANTPRLPTEDQLGALITSAL